MELMKPSRVSLLSTGGAFFALVLFLVPTANAANIVWTGTTSTDWATALNWSGGSVPASTDIAVFNGSPTFQPTAAINTFVGGLLFEAGNATATTITTSTLNRRLNVGSSGIQMDSGTAQVNLGASGAGTQGVSITANQNWKNDSASSLSVNRVSVDDASTPGTYTLTINGSGSGGTTFLNIVGDVNDAIDAARILALVINTTGGNTTLNNANTFSGGVTLTQGNLVLVDAAAAGSGNLALNGGRLASTGTRTNANTVTIGGDVTFGDVTPNNGKLTFSRTVNLAGSTRTLTAVTDTTFNGIVSNGGITKVGSGAMILNGVSANTYTGLTTVSAGGLTLAKTAGVDAIAGDVLVNGTGTLTLGASDQIKNTSTVDVATGGTFAMATFNETVAGVKFSGGTITGGSALAPVTLTVGTSIDLQSGTSSANVYLAGAASATKTTSGPFTLTGANTYSGGTTLSQGLLQIGIASTGSVGAITNSAIGSGTLALNGGTLSSSTTVGRTLLNAVTVGGNVTLGDAINTGPLTFSAGVELGNSSRTLTTASAVNLNGAVINGSVIKDGSSTLTFNGANTFSGLTISAGTVAMSSPNVGSVGSITSSSIGTGGLTFNGGFISSSGTSDRTVLNAVNFTGNAGFGGIGAGTLTFSANANLGGGIRTLTTVTDTTFNGIVSNGGINKAGASTLTLGGANTYTGNTTVSAGALQLATSGSMRFVIGSSGVNNAVTGTGTTTMNGQFTFDLTGASTNTNATWTIVAASLNPTYGTGFSVAGFIGDGLGNWNKETNGVRYIFSQSSGVLSVRSLGGVTPYNAWVNSWPGFIQTTPTDDPDGDGYNNNIEFAFGGNPTIGTGAVLTAVLVGSDVVFSYVAMITPPDAVIYEVQTTTDLSASSWSKSDVIPTRSANQEGINQPSSYERKEFRTPATAKGFYRVQATIAP